MDAANIQYGFLVAAKSGRVGLPGAITCHRRWWLTRLPDTRIAFFGPGRHRSLHRYGRCAGAGTRGDRTGFIGAHLYPHWFELPANHARYYPFYAKCIELGIPVQMQVGQSLIYSKEQRAAARWAGLIYLDDIACDLPELKLIGSHVGIPWHDEMIAMAWKHENVYIATDAHSPGTGRSVVKYLNSMARTRDIRHRFPGAAI